MKTSHDHVLELLGKGLPMTIQAMSERTGIKQSTLERRLMFMHRANEVYIWDWKMGAEGKRSAVWALGDDDDAPKITWRPPTDMSAIAKLREFFRSYDFGPFGVAAFNVAQGAR